MSSVLEIETAIEQLPPDAKIELRDWILQHCPEPDDDIVMPRQYQQKVLDALDEP